MKHLLKYCFFLLLSIGFVSCNNIDEDNNEKVTLNFSFVQKDILSATPVVTGAPSKATINITDMENNPVYYEIVSLIAVGDSYITEDISLPVGNYKLQDYVIQDEAMNVVYLAPKENTEMAVHVNDPLPMEFAVSKDETTTITPEVIHFAAGTVPSDYGYASFEFDVVETVKVYVQANTCTNASSCTRTDATVSVYENSISGKFVTSVDVTATGNEYVILKNDPNISYFISATKPGYQNVEMTKSSNEISELTSENLTINFTNTTK